MTDREIQEFLEAAYGDRQGRKLHDAEIDENLFVMMVLAITFGATLIMLFTK